MRVGRLAPADLLVRIRTLQEEVEETYRQALEELDRQRGELADEFCADSGFTRLGVAADRYPDPGSPRVRNRSGGGVRRSHHAVVSLELRLVQGRIGRPDAPVDGQGGSQRPRRSG
jgi:hypothetical protein